MIETEAYSSPYFSMFIYLYKAYFENNIGFKNNKFQIKYQIF